ncbi:DUF6880 family protein [Psychrobacter sp. 72-O-c]|uniref:DUF6880 family protein n=1 Tax=Psychrobacter sp. 72-O-c TaxID=2774125 RepID=UPI001918B67C|nr:DUF6880 family protein [Psychrobacter sp. 72-O-c]
MLNSEQKQLLAQLSNTTLVNFVADIYGVDKLLDKKIERLLLQSDKPKLIKKLTTTLKGLKRRRKFIDYWESSEFATELHHLASDVMSLYPEQPSKCLELIELFISSTNSSLKRCDDSNGEVGGVYSDLAQSWLTVASTCYEQEKSSLPIDEQDILSQAWQEKVKAMISDNNYGTKDDILLGVNQLLSESEIRGLILDYQQYYEEVRAKKSLTDQVDKKKSAYDMDHTLIYEKMNIERTLKNLAGALGDVTLFEEIYLNIYTARPLHSRQLQELLRFLVDNNAHDVAQRYLRDDWRSRTVADQVKRLDWLSEIYNKQDNTEASMAVLGEAFELQASPARLKAIMSVATPAEQAYWRKEAHKLAGQQENIMMATSLLLEIGETALANQIAVARHTEFADVHYTALTQLLKELPVGTHFIQVIIYRSLLNDILDSARSKAYGHAARYFKRLAQLDISISNAVNNYSGLDSHQDYMSSLTQKHGKKRSFWERVND